MLETMDIAKGNGVSLIIDAAGEVYPLDWMKELAVCGAHAVCFSNKYIGAPQSTGLLTGLRSTVEDAYLNSFIAYETHDNHNIGRGDKLDRQEIVASVVALREWFTMDHDARMHLQNESFDLIYQGLDNISGINLRKFQDRYWFEVWVTIDEDVVGVSASQIAADLKKGQPPIIVRQREPSPSSSFQIAVHQLRPGEPQIVVGRIRELLGA
jgi:L-seryl-tRNA(Ser) seleniumtransferase